MQLFKMEDVSMGMWVEQFNSSNPVQYSHSWKFCQFGCMEGYYTAHYQSPRQMICLWEKLRRGKAQCCNLRWRKMQFGHYHCLHSFIIHTWSSWFSTHICSTFVEMKKRERGPWSGCVMEEDTDCCICDKQVTTRVLSILIWLEETSQIVEICVVYTTFEVSQEKKTEISM